MSVTKKIVSLAVFVAILLSLVMTVFVKPKVKEEKLAVATSFYPLYEFATAITGDRASVINLTPAGAEPHDFEPSTQDLVSIEESQLLLIIGQGFEPWAEKIEQDFQTTGPRVVAVSEGIADSSTGDPHVWLDPVLAQDVVKKIYQVIVDADPDQTQVYEQNTQQLLGKLETLDQEFRSGLADCNKNKIVTSHAAFGYLSTRYGFEQIAIQRINLEGEFSTQDLANVAELARTYDVKYIFFETLVSPRLAETLAQEVGAETLVLNPIEGLSDEELANGQDYFSVQRQNLVHLRMALECQ